MIGWISLTSTQIVIGENSDLSNTSVTYKSFDNRSVGPQSGQDNGMKNSNFNLPSILLTNLQSFGKLGKSDKSAELELVLEHNQIDIGVLTETWATEATLNSLEFEDYTKFHSVRKNCLMASGGLSIFVKAISQQLN